MNVTRNMGYAWLVAAAGLLACAQAVGSPTVESRPADATVQGFDVSVEIALASLQSLADGHLQKMADSMRLLATAQPARSADWHGVKGPFAELARRNAAALNWFALPDGSYWSLQDGKEPGNLAGRDYFPKVLAGETVLGQLVYSTATGKPVAIVAVPVLGAEGAVVAVLGASIYLDELSRVIGQQMSIDEGLIFYSFDHTGTVALVWDKDLIFFAPRKSGDEGLTRAFDEMLTAERGIVSYAFRDVERTVAFRRSSLSGWWYAFGRSR
jgi:hypothetical protein